MQTDAWTMPIMLSQSMVTLESLLVVLLSLVFAHFAFTMKNRPRRHASQLTLLFYDLSTHISLPIEEQEKERLREHIRASQLCAPSKRRWTALVYERISKLYMALKQRRRKPQSAGQKPTILPAAAFERKKN
ncbi:hypothetical protein GGI42DRAFT_331606 [Trichoderma sp. SZMC 28013]